MGYYTRYTMKIMDTSGDEVFEISDLSDVNDALEYQDEWDDDLTKVLREFNNDYDGFYGLMSEEDCKWYDHEDAMKILSQKFKQFVFLLNGEGEESGDVWRKYFYNGHVKQVVPEVRWPEFDVEKEFYGTTK